MHGAHRRHLERKDGGGDWRAEQRRKGGAHAAHDEHVPIRFVQMERLTEQIGQAAAQLQRGALPTGAAAQQVRDARGEEDQRRGHGRDRFPTAHGGQDQVGAPLGLFAKAPVEPDDQQAAGVQQPRDGIAALLHPAQADAKQRSHTACQQADRQRNETPAQKGVAGGLPSVFKPGWMHTFPPPIGFASVS